MSENFDKLAERFCSVMSIMPDAFDTHDFILVLAKLHQRIYIQVLYESESETPFKAVHSLIGKALKKRHDIKEAPEQVTSKDIFGQRSACSEWQKV